MIMVDVISVKELSNPLSRSAPFLVYPTNFYYINIYDQLCPASTVAVQIMHNARHSIILSHESQDVYKLMFTIVHKQQSTRLIGVPSTNNTSYRHHSSAASQSMSP